MKTKARNFLFAIFLIISIGLSFWGGTQYGIKLGWELYTPTLGMNAHMQALSTQISLEKIDQNQVEESHVNLMMSLSGNILILDELVTKNNENADIFKNVLARIANHRERFPSIYSNKERHDQNLGAIYYKVSEILEKYKD